MLGPGATDYQALYSEFQPLVRRLIRQYAEDPDGREDLAGEIYFQFRKLLDEYDPARGIPLRPYLIRSLTARVYTYARRGWCRKRREVSIAAHPELESQLDAPDPTAEWAERMEEQEVLRRLPGLIATLPPRQRTVLIWHYYEARSYDEIAGTLSIRPATARSILRHAIRSLRNRMSE